MTDNQLLLHRLAELMLEKEQTVLSVDLLFDDNQIGDFIKTIQIDSPYQQLIFEGVLTESVMDEKLYVSFTVEGYFHYILGDVIYKKSEGKSPEFLKDILENNRLNGAKEGIEQCLIRDVQQNDFLRLAWLIDNEVLESNLSIYQLPLQISLKIKDTNNTLSRLFRTNSTNDWKLLNQLLKDSQFSNDKKNEIALFVINRETFDTYFSQMVFGRAVLELNDKQLQSEMIEKFKQYISYKDGILASFEDLDKISALASIYEKNRQSDLWLTCMNDCIQYELSNLEASYQYLATSYNQKGLILLGEPYQQYDEALDCFQKAMEIRQKFTPNEILEISTIEHNLGLTYLYLNSFDSAIQHCALALEQRAQIRGKYSVEYAQTLGIIAIGYKGLNDYDNAQNILKQSFNIIKKINAKDYWKMGNILNNLGDLYREIEQFDQALETYDASYGYFQKFYSVDHIDLARVTFNWGLTYQALQEYDQALEKYFKTEVLITNVLGKENQYIHKIYDQIGTVLNLKKDYEKALFNLKKGLDICLLYFAEDSEDALSLKYEIAKNLYQSEKFEASITILKSTYQIDKKDIYPFYIGLCHEALKNYNEALNFFIESVELRKDSLGYDDERTELAAQKCIEIAKKIKRIEDLPAWIKDLNNDR